VRDENPPVAKKWVKWFSKIAARSAARSKGRCDYTGGLLLALFRFVNTMFRRRYSARFVPLKKRRKSAIFGVLGTFKEPEA